MPTKDPEPAEQPVTEKPTRRRTQPANHLTNSPIEQAIALRTAAGQTNEWIRSLTRQKRQTKLVASTLESLKELQKVAG